MDTSRFIIMGIAVLFTLSSVAMAQITGTSVQTGLLLRDERVDPYHTITETDSGVLEAYSEIIYPKFEAEAYIDLSIAPLLYTTAQLNFDQGIKCTKSTAYGYFGDNGFDSCKFQIYYHTRSLSDYSVSKCVSLCC